MENRHIVKLWSFHRQLFAKYIRPLGFLVVGFAIGLIAPLCRINETENISLKKIVHELPPECVFEQYADLVYGIDENPPVSVGEIEVIRCWDATLSKSDSTLLFSQFPNLTVLDLSKSQFECSWLAGLVACGELRVLVLDQCHLTGDLPKILSSTNITGLSIKHAKLDDSNTLMELMQIPSLRWIVIGDDEFERISEGHASPPTSLIIANEMDGVYTLSRRIKM